MHIRVVLAASFAFAAASTGAAANGLPPIKVTDRNAVPECVTPGRLMEFIRSRNSSLDPRFEKIAVGYMRIGEELKIRWDVAFYQMAIETSYLTFRREGGKRGDVKMAQHNFAGLGATGNGAPGESFPDVETGVRAHLQHVLMYSGETVENPVAERTRNTQTWLVKEIQKKANGPVTFAHLAQRWATSKAYAEALETHGQRFHSEFCQKPDPNPELLAEVRGADKPKVAAVEPARPGRDVMRRAVEEEREQTGGPRRSGLGAAQLAKQNDPKAAVIPEPTTPAGPRPKVPAGLTPIPLEEPVAPAAIPKAEAPKAVDKPKTADKPKAAEKPADPVPYQQASAGLLLPKAAPKAPAAAAGAKCKVFTASYGGFRAILIQAPGDAGVNYTVLDVNEGSEQRGAEAYIQAYAKGGQVAGQFANPTLALDKAFELCPEG